MVLIPDDGRKAETCSKYIAYGVSIQIIVLTEPNDKKEIMFEFSGLNFEPNQRVLFSLVTFLVFS
jgi:hypothetical protein